MKNNHQLFAPSPAVLIPALLFAMAMLPNFLFAQFFTTYQSNQIQWPSGGLARYQALQAPALSKSVQIVSTVDVRNVQSNGILSFQLQGSSSVLQAEASLITDDPTMGFIWSGKLTTAPGGYVSFIYRDGKTAGFIQIGKDFYEISPINNSYQFFVKRNNDYTPSQACAVASTPPEAPPGPNDCDYLPTYNTCPTLITVLLILTPEAKLMVENMYGSVDVFALLGQASVNSAFWNSDIPNKEIRVKWVVKSGFPFANPNSLSADLISLPVFSEPERSANKADLVVLIPHIIYDIGGGVANCPTPPDPSRAFSIVMPQYFLSIYAFAHELGHNLGCRHNWSFDLGNDDTKVCAHAKRYIPPIPLPILLTDVYGSWHTILGKIVLPEDYYEMEENGNTYYISIKDDYPILHYSNPSISYNGESTGRIVTKNADNADQIRKVGCAVGSYDPTTELSVSISAAPCTTPITLTATITPPSAGLPGIAPYTVYWFWNTSGVFPTGGSPQFLGTGTTLNLSSHPACPVFWIKCVVVSSDNVSISRIQKVTVNSCQCLMDHRPGLSGNSDLTTQPLPGTSLFPNPVSHGILLVQSKALSMNDVITYKLVDTWGKVIATGKTEHTSESQLAIPVEGYNDGLYFVSLQMPNGIQETHKFMIAKSN